jgi:hypothetical protein
MEILGRQVPEDFLREPGVEPQNVFLWDAFWELGSERLKDLGPIPYRAIRDYAAEYGIAGDHFDLFLSVIRSLDGEYLTRLSPKATPDRKMRATVDINDHVGVSNLLKRLAKPAEPPPET